MVFCGENETAISTSLAGAKSNIHMYLNGTYMYLNLTLSCPSDRYCLTSTFSRLRYNSLITETRNLQI